MKGGLTMTKSWALFKKLSWPRFVLMNWVVAFELLMLVISGLWQAIRGDFHAYTPFFTLCGFMMIPGVVSLVMLAVQNERTTMTETYRLIPISDWKLYLLNLGASLANQIYLWLVQGILFGITLLIGHNSLEKVFNGVPEGLSQLNSEVNLVQFGLTAIVVGILSLLLIWSTISLVHFVTNAASSFLPRFRQNVVNVIIYIIVMALAIRLVSALIGGLSFLSSQAINGGVIDNMWVGIAVMVIVTLIEGALNVWILSKWVEPKLD